MPKLMNGRIKFAWTLLGPIIFTITVVNSASAGSYEEAIAASKRGDYATAMRLLRPLAEQGIADAQDTLGFMYEWGHGAPKDKAEAAKWFAKAAKAYRKAADRGNADAQNKLGGMYNFGRGVPKNYAEAVKWYRKAAEQGNADAQESLGVSYQEGQGVPQDKGEAAKWYAKAAKVYPA
jgi:uncharacterized protein